MRELSNLEENEMTMLADAFGLEPVESDDEITVYFSIDGMEDHILTVDGYDRVTTYTDLTSNAKSAMFTEIRDVMEDDFTESDVFERIIKNLIGIHEVYTMITKGLQDD